MKVKTVKNTISIDGDLVFETAEQSKEELLAALDKVDTAKPVGVDLEKVNEIDSSGFQLILSLLNTLRERETLVSIKKVRSDLYDLAQLGGLNKFLKIDSANVVES